MRPVYGLGIFIPVALVLDLTRVSASLVFATSAIAIVATVLVSDGESTWFEGFQLIALYAVTGILVYAA
jgi:Ca2+/H+ antiporter